MPTKNYRSTFLKLSRNLAPNGKNLTRVEVRALDDTRGSGVVLGEDSRKSMNRALRADKVPSTQATPVELRGVLRGVHLDRDWLELLSEGKAIQVRDLPEAVDDVIGPMVNRSVIVYANLTSHGYTFVDVESDD